MEEGKLKLANHERSGAFEARLAALSQPAAFPLAASQPISIIQTHASAVLLAEDKVYKLKKPNNFGFFDYSTAALRQHYCTEEVRLNARLAPEVYLGVAPVLVSSDKQPRFGPILACEQVPGPGTVLEGGEVVDYAVVMVRLPDEATLEALVQSNKADARLLAAVARRIAIFHASAETHEQIEHYGELETIRGNWEENFEQMHPYIGRTLDVATFDAIERYARGFMLQREQLFSARVRDGRIRDCHGDLRLQHIYCLDTETTLNPAGTKTTFSPALAIIDCIEFNERFRFGDVASEVAFLAMELDEAGRGDLAREFEAAYVTASGDESLRELLPFYRCYRACVRGKVLAFQLDEPEVPVAQQESARQRSRALFDLAARYTKSPTAPVLLMIGGLMGTGKSTLAATLQHELGWRVMGSDVARKQLSDTGPAEPHPDAFGTGLYSAEWTARTYAALLQQATTMLLDACSIILDASFSRRADRQAVADSAAKMGARVVFAECKCPREVALQRLARRWQLRTEQGQQSDTEASGAENAAWASDGRPELYNVQSQAWEKVTPQEAESIEYVEIMTALAPEVYAKQLYDVLGITRI